MPITVLLGAAVLGTAPTAPAAAPPGSYSTHFVLAKPADCVPAGERGFKEPICIESEVGRVMILEGSTDEIMAECHFEFGSADFVTASSKPGTSYACERKRDQTSGQTDVWVYSQHANLPILHVYYLMKREHQGIWDEALVSAVDKVVHAPDGSSYSDPYEDVELRFDGYKRLFLVAKKGHLKALNKAVDKLRTAGYEAIMGRFDAGVGDVGIYETFDGRKLIHEKVLKKQGWVARKDPASTHGNKGTYDLAPYILSFKSVQEERTECGGTGNEFRGGFQIDLPLMPDDKGGYSGEGTLELYGDTAGSAWEYRYDGRACTIVAKPAKIRARLMWNERLYVSVDGDTDEWICEHGAEGANYWWVQFLLTMHRDEMLVVPEEETAWVDLTPEPPAGQDETRVKRWERTEKLFDCGEATERTTVELKRTGN